MVGLQRKLSEIRLGYLKLWFNINKLQDKFLRSIPQVLARIYFILCTVLAVSFSSVQVFSCVLPFVTPWTPTRQASLFITSSWSLLKLMSIESVMPSSHLILCLPLLLLSSIFPIISIFSNESALHLR